MRIQDLTLNQYLQPQKQVWDKLKEMEIAPCQLNAHCHRLLFLSFFLTVSDCQYMYKMYKCICHPTSLVVSSIVHIYHVMVSLKIFTHAIVTLSPFNKLQKNIHYLTQMIINTWSERLHVLIYTSFLTLITIRTVIPCTKCLFSAKTNNYKLKVQYQLWQIITFS